MVNSPITNLICDIIPYSILLCYANSDIKVIKFTNKTKSHYDKNYEIIYNSSLPNNFNVNTQICKLSSLYNAKNNGLNQPYECVGLINEKNDFSIINLENKRIIKTINNVHFSI